MSVLRYRIGVLALAGVSLDSARAIRAQSPSVGGSQGQGVTLIEHVNVIPMTTETVLRDQVVLIRDGRIASVGAAIDAASIPATAVRVDGRGKFLIPGLVDMHMHLYADGTLPDSVTPYELGVVVANGVTSVRLMAGSPQQLRWRAAVARGEVLGPRLWVSSPAFTTRPDQNTRIITSADDVRAAVRDVTRAGYDFVKVTFGIVGPVYDALVDEARRGGIRVVGHVEPAVGLRRAMSAGQELEHLDSFFEDALADSVAGRPSVTQYGVYRPANWASLDWIDDKKLDALAKEVVNSRTWVGPTLSTFNQAFGDPFTDAELMALPDWKYIPDSVRVPHMRSRKNYWSQAVPVEKRHRYAAIRNSIVKRIADAGGADHILAGSDAPDLLMVYGFGLHRELQALVRAGLTPYQAVAAATRNAAQFLDGGNEFGTIQPGLRADLVLLEANPLEDIRATTRIDAVFVGGRLLKKPELDRLLVRGEQAIRAR